MDTEKPNVEAGAEKAEAAAEKGDTTADFEPSFSLGFGLSSDSFIASDAPMLQQEKNTELKKTPSKKSKNRQKGQKKLNAGVAKKSRVSLDISSLDVLPVDFFDSDSESESDFQELGKKSGFVDADVSSMAISMKKAASTQRKNVAYAERYYEWRREYGAKLFGVSSSFQKRIQEFNTVEIREFGQHLVYFLQQVVQRNGKPYKASTIRDFLATFGRLLREGRHERIRNTCQEESDINVFEHPFFAAARDAANKVIADIMVNQRRNPDSFNMITDKMIVEVLAAEEFSPTTPNGLLNRVMFYCITNFMIRGGRELWNVVWSDFQMVQDRYGRFVRFMQRPCKNRPGDLNNCKDSDLRKPVEVYEAVNEDLYKTFENYMSRLPAVRDGEDVSERHFLKASKTFVAGGSTCWYTVTNIGINKIAKVGKIMGNITGIKMNNKTLRHYAVTKARQQGIPDDNLKDLTGHKRVETLRNYDHSGKQAMMAMQASIMPGGKPYADALSLIQEKLITAEDNIEMPIAVPELSVGLGEREVSKAPFKQIMSASKSAQQVEEIEKQHLPCGSGFSVQEQTTNQQDSQLKQLQAQRVPLSNLTNTGVPGTSAGFTPRGFNFNFSFY